MVGVTGIFRHLAGFMALSALLLCYGQAFAQSTTAGTLITNEAVASFSVGGVDETLSATAVFTVQEVIDVTVTSANTDNIFADSPDVGVISQFEVANIGNGTEDYILSAGNNADADQFDFDIPAGIEIFIDNPVEGTPGAFDAEDDLFVTSVTIAPETTITVFVLADIPADLTQNDLGILDLTAASNTAGAPGADPGTALDGLGDLGTDAIVGTTQATATASATYEIQLVDVTLEKTVLSVADIFGGDQFLPGSTVVYRIELVVAGGLAEGLVISDPIPENTTYVPESIDLDGADQTDIDGDDESDFNITTPGAVTVNLGDVPGGTTHTVDITVTIN